MKKQTKRKYLFYIILGFSFLLLLFIFTSYYIGFEVRKICDQAKMEYKSEYVEALTSLLNDEHRGFRARNHAIWALGQLGDKRALPVLEKYYTGNIPSKEPIDKMISQYELKKAINLTNGGLNLTAIFWRYGID